MPSLSYGAGAYNRTAGNLPPLKCINMFVESAKTSKGSVCLQSRPGLATLQTSGPGPIRKIFSERTVLNGDDFSISGGNASPDLYRGTTLIGTLTSLTGSSVAIAIAGAQSEILIAGQGVLYSYNGTTLASTFAVGSASNNVRSVAFIGSLFVAIENDSGRVYWSTPLDGRTWNALDFFTAERRADNLLDLAALNDKLVLYGQSTVEVWAHTGDADLPFTRIEGIGSQSKGIKSTGAWTEADNTLFHVGSDGVVYRFGETFERISDHWLEAKVLGSALTSMFSFRHEGHEFICVRLGSNTYAYNAATREWCEFETGGNQWIAQCAAMKETTAYFGHQATGAVMTFSGWTDLGTPLERRFSAVGELSGPLPITNVKLWANAGQAPTGVTPTVSLRYSRDAGNAFSAYTDSDLGNAADGGNIEYRVVPQWRRLGMFDDPGVLLEIKCSAATDFRVSDVKINEMAGGRSRA